VNVGYVDRGHLLFTLIGLPLTLQIQTITPCRAWLMPTEVVRTWIGSDARIGELTSTHLLGRLYMVIGELRFSTFATVRQRVARHLVELAAHAGEVVAVSATELADMTGSVREVVGRLLRELERERMIELVADGLRLVDVTRLRAEYAELLA
jgi:CRP-like cAMP-binding protein